jgi:hypothetical protein
LTYRKIQPKIIGMKKFSLFLVPLAALMAACVSAPTAVEDIPAPVIDEPVTISVSDSVFETEVSQPLEPAATVTQEMYDNTLAEVRRFIDGLNRMISSGNFTNWRNTLSEEYNTRISSPEFLAEQSESPTLKSRRIVLRTPNDYFTHVVVPSRANSRVDEIEFVTENRIKAYYIETRTIRHENNEIQSETRHLRLYDLIKIDDAWKIVN